MTSGLVSVSQDTAIVPPPNLSQTFNTTTNKVTASKGYFPYRVEISWLANGAQNIEQMKIYRKILGTMDSILIASVNPSSGLFIDNNAEARVFYEYTLRGEKNCNGTILYSNQTSDIGFRNPMGIVSGQVQYSGFVAVKGVKILVTPSNGITGKSLKFVPGSSAQIKQTTAFTPNGKIRLEFWLKPANDSSQVYISKAGSFSFERDASSYTAKLFVSGVEKNVSIQASNLNLNSWNHVSVQYDLDTLKLYINGLLKGTTLATGILTTNTNPIIFGDTDANFYLDEFRLFNTTDLDTNVYIDFPRILNGNKPNTSISLHFDEGVGNYAYDVSSSSNVFNNNHLLKTTSVTWDNDHPSSSQLGYIGLTDAGGNYTVSGIAYSGSGDNFTLTPLFNTHSFSPNTRTVYISDAGTVFNSLNFIDQSSFKVTGRLLYDNTSCPVAGANLKIDGELVVKNGSLVQTQPDGSFTIQVPIGLHNISVVKANHTMSVGRFPNDENLDFDFQEPVTDIQFFDATTRTLVGRVVGGLVEANKKPNLGRSKNNIGVARIRLKASVSGNDCMDTAFYTSIANGEYQLSLPPLNYTIDSLYIVKDKNRLNKAISTTVFTNSESSIDLRTVSERTFVSDSVFSPQTGTFSGVVDTTSYHVRRDFVYRSLPKILVTDTLDRFFIGEDSLKVGSAYTQIRPLNNVYDPTNWPTFIQGKQYQIKTKGFEFYENKDAAQIIRDTVLLSGKVKFTNSFIDGADPNSIISLNDGVAVYNFVAGSPSISKNNNDSQLSYTRSLQIDLEPEGAAPVKWVGSGYTTPNVFYGYILGKRSNGVGFVTSGPDLVDIILRDPPGSQSFASFGSGKSITSSSSFSINGAAELSTSVDLKLGTKFLTGVGVATETEVTNTTSLGISTTASIGSNDELVETTSTYTTYTTRDDPDHVGANADLFIGRARNWLVGVSENIELVEISRCKPGAVECFGPNINGYKKAKLSGYAMAPNGFRTKFAFTQDEIETLVIPQLVNLRKSYFTDLPEVYISAKPPTDPLYGINNDDPLLGDPARGTPNIYDNDDTTGMSYTYLKYKAKKAGIPDSLLFDKIRDVNTQIALWKRSLAQNEKDKWVTKDNKNNNLFIENYSLGAAILNQSYTFDKQSVSTINYELAISESIKNEFSATVAGTGAGVNHSMSLSQQIGRNNSEDTTVTTSFDYTLSDGDNGDLYSISVYKAPSGTGNIFITSGGRTMCPYEDELVLHYYNPTNPSAFIGSHSYNTSGYASISPATSKREIPEINITPAFQANIPAEQKAVYQLELTNNAQLDNNDIELRVYVASQSNPNGAIIKIDGLDPNTTYTIPTGASLFKTLTVERGPIETKYDDLMIIFASKCSDDIADTAYISAHFIPSCTELDLVQPPNNWVFNNGINDTAMLLINNYDYNYGAGSYMNGTTEVKLGLNKLGLEYKPSNSSIWTPFHSFHKYPASNLVDSIRKDQTYSQFLWPIQDLPDGQYDLKSKSHCLNKDGSISNKESKILSGIIDRINPSPFGTPSPADGILDPNDDISIQFNEPIEGSSLSFSNIDVRGVTNGGTSDRFTSLLFDGVDDFAVVDDGTNLQRKNFTIELWAKRDASSLGEQVLFYQGADPTNQMTFGFSSDQKLQFGFGNILVKSNSAQSNPTSWHHYAVSYNFANQTADLYVDGSLVNSGNNSILFNYESSGKIYFGKNNVSNSEFYKGNLQGVRLWNKARDKDDIAGNFNKNLSRTQQGLLYNWNLDEAEGTLAKDHIRSKNALINGPVWVVTPSGYSAQFNGSNQHVEISSSKIGIKKEMDFTIEFWFKSNQSGPATIFSSGKSDGLGDDSLKGWTIDKDASGKFIVRHNGNNFEAVSTNYFDDKWHHFAMVMQRNTNLSAYIDGNLQNTVLGTGFNSLIGNKLFVGSRGYFNSTTQSNDQYYSGMIDDFRLWNTARKSEQIKRDKRVRLKNDEVGLICYLPFENYTFVGGPPSLTPTFNDNSSINATVVQVNGVQTSTNTPTLKLPRPVSAINFVYSLNNDKIVITPTSSPESIENVTLDITVKNLLDKQGNKMQSPKSWIAYINKNQVKWNDSEFNLNKNIDTNLVFNSSITNTGGATKSFTISNLPSWVTASITSGTISPNQTINIQFTINSGVTIGDYTQDLFLLTDFNFPEKLTLNLKVRRNSPNWQVNPSDFQYSMSITGQLKMNDLISANTEDKLVAMINGQVRGVAKLAYVPAYDKYEVFLNVYSNSDQADTITFQMWNSSKGELFVDVTPSLIFEENSFVGTVSNPQMFVGTKVIIRNVVAQNGWTWVSFPLNSAQFASTDKLMNKVNIQQGDVMKGIAAYDQYDPTLGWVGNLANNNGLNAASTYKLKISQLDTIELKGQLYHPDSVDINIQPGWNWIGFVSPKNLDVQTALSNYNAQTGDVVKSQYEFAYYDNLTGWSGSLQFMKPGLGYMLKSTATSVFHYPASSLYGPAPSGMQQNDKTFLAEKFYPNEFNQNMSIVASTNICDTWLKEGTLRLAIMDNSNSIRGYAAPILDPLSGQYFFYLTAYGVGENEEMNLAIVDLVNEQIIPNYTGIKYRNDQVSGSKSKPIQVNIDSRYACAGSSAFVPSSINFDEQISVHPNPFKNSFTVEATNLPSDARLELTDAIGNRITISNMNSDGPTVVNYENLAPGVYFVRVIGTNYDKQCKIIKL
ncbi:MAG: T9SS type A sorting domain-containing protein [Bacteroidetes bacterium]|nr:T9SS type A sorting domain-containing protein [Bacteroidota bacterium]